MYQSMIYGDEMNIQIPMSAMLENIDRRIEFLRKRGEDEDMITIDALLSLRDRYVGSGKSSVDF